MKRVEQDGRRVVAFLAERRAGAAGAASAPSSKRHYERLRSAEARPSSKFPARRALRPDDADPGGNGQRLDLFQGQSEPPLGPDGLPRQRGPQLQPLHGDPRGHLRRTDRGLQPGQHQSLAASSLSRRPDRRASTSTGFAQGVRATAVKFLDRVVDHRLPIRLPKSRNASNEKVAADRARRHGPAGRCSLSCAFRSPAPERDSQALRLGSPRRFASRRSSGAWSWPGEHGHAFPAFRESRYASG